MIASTLQRFFCVATSLLIVAAAARGDWSDDFTGGIHNPPGGAWGFAGFPLSNPGEQDPAYQPTFAGDRVRVPSPITPTNGRPMALVAGWIASSAGTMHHYGDVRVSGTVGVGSNNGLGNNNEIGLLARADDFNVYALVVDHGAGQVRLVKSLDANPAAPIEMTSAAIAGYSPQTPYHLVLDVLDTADGTRLTGRIYQNSASGSLVGTLVAADDFGDAVAGPPHPAYYSGFFVQYNADQAQPSFVDAWFDDMASQTLRPGDVNFSGGVDRGDLAALVHGLGRASGATWDDGDIDGNGAVDLRDAIRLRNGLAPVELIGPPVAVPEPAPWSLAIAAMAMLLPAAARGLKHGVLRHGEMQNEA